MRAGRYYLEFVTASKEKVDKEKFQAFLTATKAWQGVQLDQRADPDLIEVLTVLMEAWRNGSSIREGWALDDKGGAVTNARLAAEHRRRYAARAVP